MTDLVRSDVNTIRRLLESLRREEQRAITRIRTTIAESLGRGGYMPFRGAVADEDIANGAIGQCMIATGIAGSESATTEALANCYNATGSAVWDGALCIVYPLSIQDADDGYQWVIAESWSATHVRGTAASTITAGGNSALNSPTSFDGTLPATITTYIPSATPGTITAGDVVLATYNNDALRWESFPGGGAGGGGGADVKFEISSNDTTAANWVTNVTPHATTTYDTAQDVQIKYEINFPSADETIDLFFDASSVSGHGTNDNELFGKDSTGAVYWQFANEETKPTPNVVVKVDAGVTTAGELLFHFDPDDVGITLPPDMDEKVRTSDQDSVAGYLVDKHVGVTIAPIYVDSSKDLTVVHDIDVDAFNNERLLSFIDASAISGHSITGPLVLGIDASKNWEFRQEGAAGGMDKFFKVTANDTTTGYWMDKVVDPWVESYETLHDLQVDWVILDPGMDERAHLFINVSQEFSSYNSSVDQLYGHTSVGSRAWTIGNKLGHTTLQKVYVDTIGDINWGVFFANELTYTAEDVPVSFRTVQPGLYEGPEFFVDVSRLASYVQDKTQLIGKTTEGTGTAAMLGFALEGTSITAYPRFHAERINSGAERQLRFYWDLSTMTGWTSGGGKMITNNGSGGALIAETAYVVSADSTDTSPGYLVEEFSNAHAWGAGIYNATEDALIHHDVVNSPNSKLQSYLDASAISGSAITGDDKFLKRAASTGALSWDTLPSGMIDTDELVKVLSGDTNAVYLDDALDNTTLTAFDDFQDMKVHHQKITVAGQTTLWSFIDASLITGSGTTGDLILQRSGDAPRTLKWVAKGSGADTDELVKVLAGDSSAVYLDTALQTTTATAWNDLQDLTVHHQRVAAGGNTELYSFVDMSLVTGAATSGDLILQRTGDGPRTLQWVPKDVGVDLDEKFSVTSGGTPGYWDERVTGGSTKTAFDVTVGWAISGSNVGLHFDSSTIPNYSGVESIQVFGHNGSGATAWNFANKLSHSFVPVYLATGGNTLDFGVDFENENVESTEDLPISFKRVSDTNVGAAFFMDASRVATGYVADKNQLLGKTTEGAGTAAYYSLEGESSRSSPHPILKHERINSGAERLLRTWLNLDEISGWDGQGSSYVLTNNGTSGALEFAGGQGVPRGYQSGVKQRVIKNESDKIAYEDVPKRPHTSNWTGFIGTDPTIDYVIPWSSQIEAAVADHALSLSAGEYTVLETGLWLITISSLFSIQGINTRVTNCYATMEFHNGSSWIPSGVGGTTSQGSIPIDPDYVASGVPYPSCNTSETTVFPLTAGWKIRVSARARQTDKATPRLTSVEATTSLTMWKVGG